MAPVLIVVVAIIVMVFFVWHTGKVHKREAAIRQQRLAIAREISHGMTYHTLHNLLQYNQWEDCHFKRADTYWYLNNIRMDKDVNTSKWPEFVRQIARRSNLPMTSDDNLLDTIRDIADMYIRIVTDRDANK